MHQLTLPNILNRLINFVIVRMEELGIGPKDRLVYFGQLLGMCDQVSFPLGKFYSIHNLIQIKVMKPTNIKSRQFIQTNWHHMYFLYCCTILTENDRSRMKMSD